jgi:hypothetical protein
MSARLPSFEERVLAGLIGTRKVLEAEGWTGGTTPGMNGLIPSEATDEDGFELTPFEYERMQDEKIRWLREEGEIWESVF